MRASRNKTTRWNAQNCGIDMASFHRVNISLCALKTDNNKYNIWTVDQTICSNAQRTNQKYVIYLSAEITAHIPF